VGFLVVRGVGGVCKEKKKPRPGEKSTRRRTSATATAGDFLDVRVRERNVGWSKVQRGGAEKVPPKSTVSKRGKKEGRTAGGWRIAKERKPSCRKNGKEGGARLP